MIKCTKCQFEAEKSEFKENSLGCTVAFECPKCKNVFTLPRMWLPFSKDKKEKKE